MRLSGETTTPTSLTTLSSSEPLIAVAITGLPLASIPASLDGITAPAMVFRCGSTWMSAKLSNSFS